MGFSAQVTLPCAGKQVELHLRRNFAQKRNFAQVAVGFAQVRGIPSVQYHPFERLAERHAERDVTEQRLGQRCLADLEHEIMLMLAWTGHKVNLPNLQ
jgi:hypothetical protein